MITGAGISFEAPSNMPSSERLATLAWEALARSVGVPPNLVAAVSGRINDRLLRLEQLLDLMTFGGQGMPLDVLVTVYNALDSNVFNMNHLRLSSLEGVEHSP